MTAWAKLVPSTAWWLLALVLVAGVQQYRVMSAQHEHAETRAAWAEQLRLTAEANAAVIRQQQAARLELEGRLADLDTQSTQELSNAIAENDRLRALYSAADDDRRRLRIEVRVARADATVSAATGPGSVGDAASLELSERAGSAIWNIRAGMISDRAKLEYLQEWARAVSRQ